VTLDASACIQSASGTVDPAASSLTPTLPNPTIDGSTLLLAIGSQSGVIVPQLQGYDPPFVQDAVNSGSAYVWRRDNQPAGETSWPITIVSGTARWAWWISEWSGLSTVSVPDATTGGGHFFVSNSGVQDNDSATVPSPCTPDVTDYVALAAFRSSGSVSAPTIFPAARSYSSGFSEVASLPLGDGTVVSTDFHLIVAQGFPGVTGNIDCVMTYDISGGGGYVNKTVLGWMAAYQPADPGPALGILAS
jgi:hypothetical protein